MCGHAIRLRSKRTHRNKGDTWACTGVVPAPSVQFPLVEAPMLVLTLLAALMRLANTYLPGLTLQPVCLAPYVAVRQSGKGSPTLYQQCCPEHPLLEKTYTQDVVYFSTI